MAWFIIFQLIALISLTVLLISVKGQISTPCTSSMVTSFTPCINFVTGSSSNGASPTAACCDSLKTMMSTSMDCACLLITASVPVQLPINRTLAISLPRACNMAGVPVQCKASGSPLPPPGPAFLLGPSPPPLAAAPLSPRASKATAEALAPQTPETINPPLLAPAASPPAAVEVPTTTVGIRPVLTPSASWQARVSLASVSVLLMFVSMVILKCY